MHTGTDTVVPLFLASDSGCQHGLVVSVESAIDNSSPEFRVELHIADCGLEPSVRQSMKDVWSAHPKVTALHFHELDLGDFDAMFANNRLRPATLARLQMADLMPDKARTLYLDTDVLVLGDMTELAKLDLQGNGIAGAVDWFPTLASTGYRLADLPFEVDSSATCINAGLLVADLDLWRKKGVWEQGKILLKDYSSKFDHHDQSVLNLLFAKQAHILPAQWNRQREIVDELPMILHQGGMIHYIGRTKPWHFTYRPGCGAVSAWHEQLQKTRVALPPLPSPTKRYRGPKSLLYARKILALARMKIRDRILARIWS